MIRYCLATLAALLLAGCQADPSSTPERDWPTAKPALWSVSGKNGEQGWLFGTIHALPDGVKWETPVFEDAFAKSDLLLVEIGNLGDAREAADAFEAYARTTPQPPLTSRVARADAAALGELMGRAGMSNDDFWNVKTWAAALILGNATRDSDAKNGVDRALLERDKPVEALESYSQQFSRFDALPALLQRDLLGGVAKEASLNRSDERIEAWLTGDLSVIEKDMNEGYLSSTALRETMLTERNALFSSRMVMAMEQGRKPFVAVGTAHMLRSDGLAALLAERGYVVTRIQ